MTETSTITGIEDALRQCGVTNTTLGAREKVALERDGYLVVPDSLDDEWLAGLRAAFESALADGHRHGVHVHMPWQEPIFDHVYTHPKILAAVYHILRRPFKSTGAVGRDPAPGHGQQALHADWMRTAGEPFHLVTTLWLLDDYTPDNGATRLVPGSHVMPKPLPKSMAQPESRHPQEKVIIATAGSVLIFNGHLLHSGTRNKAGLRRRVLQCPFIARDVPHLGDGKPEIPPRLPPAARYLLGEG